MNESSGNVQIIIKTVNNEDIVMRSTKQYAEKGEEIKTTEYFLDLEQANSADQVQEESEFITIEEHDPHFVSVEVANTEGVVLNDKEVIIWDELCRICANTNEQFIPIFSGEGLEHDLQSKIHSYLPLKISESDTLPNRICYNCAATLLSWHDLYKNCRSAQQRLVELQNKLNLKEQFYSEATTEEENVENVLEVETSNNDEFELSLKEEEQEEDNDDNDDDYDNAKEVQDVPEDSNRYVNFEDNRVIILDASELESLPALLSSNQSSSSYVATKKASARTSADRKAEVALAKCVINGMTMYQCPECPKCLTTAYNYTAHRRVHAQERTSNCTECGKWFSTSSSLTRHVREVHKKIKDYKCEYCERRLATRVSRDEHQRTHTNERPHVCDVCGKRFRQRASLSVHKRFHSSSIVFSCKLCEKQFKRKQDMQRHELTHTNLMPYGCSVCGKSFRSSASAIRHRQSHQADKFMCDECGECFKAEKILKGHKKRKHNSE